MRNNKFQLINYAMSTIIALMWLAPRTAMAQGWPAQYGGVMLQAFYWDSYNDSQWTALAAQTDELAQSFSLIWVPQSGNCGGQSMGYDDLYWFNNYNSSFGTEQELRQMIQALKAKGVGTLADVVVNHRKNVSNWVDFPRETYKGVTYEMVSTDICANDDDGQTKTWATQNGYQLSANNDTGEGWKGMRDLDHKSQNVQTIVKAYLDFLKNDLGYAGYRYDMVKGYAAEFTGLYNTAAQPTYSVGEYWDGNTAKVKAWLDGTVVNGQMTSAAFDFPFRYTVRDAVSGNWSKLASASLISDENYRRYAVTFVENHDTEYRSNGEKQDPILKDTLAANAFLLAMPGTPCVFMKHWQTYSTELKAMIEARKTAGINNMSRYSNFRNSQKCFANSVDGKLLVIVGETGQVSPSSEAWTKILEGYHYAYYLSSQMQTAWVSLASSIYYGSQQAVLTAVTNEQGARLVYTLDGTTPTAQSATAQSGTRLQIPLGTTVLKVGLLVDGQVKGIVSRTYTVKEKEEEPLAIIIRSQGELCAFFEAPASWTNVKCWAWNASQNFTGGSWPGVACQRLGRAENGNIVWKWHYDGTLTTQPTGIIFSNGGSPQTNDLPFENGGYYNQNGKQYVVTVGIRSVEATAESQDILVWSPDGKLLRRVPQGTNPSAVTKGLKRGLYIINNKKHLVR